MVHKTNSKLDNGKGIIKDYAEGGNTYLTGDKTMNFQSRSMAFMI